MMLHLLIGLRKESLNIPGNLQLLNVEYAMLLSLEIGKLW